MKAYEYAKVAANGQDLVATGVTPGKGNPAALGLAKRLDIYPASRKAKANARYQEWDKATETSKRWAELKARQPAMQAAAAAAAATPSDGTVLSPPSSTTIGTKVGLTLLIDFSDAPSTGTFCHENGHMLCGYPDLHDYGGNSGECGRPRHDPLQPSPRHHALTTGRA